MKRNNFKALYETHFGLTSTVTLKPIPFLSLDYQHDQLRSSILEAMARVYNRNSFVAGDELSAFESEFAEFTGTSFCVGVANGLDAITLALMSYELSQEDEVIVPANTYLATWLAVSRVGAKLVPAEPDPVSFNIDPAAVEAAVTSKTKVILPVHLYGQPCDMSALCRIAERHRLSIIEDNAQAHGAKWNGQRTGSFGLVNATSFYPTKNLGALGDAGAITTHDPNKNSLLRKLRNYGFENKNFADIQGVNSRLDELQAAVLRIKLKKLEEWNHIRSAIASSYVDQLKGAGDILLPKTTAQATHVYHQFVIRTTHRDALMKHLESKGIGTMIHYPVPPHLQSAYVSLGLQKGAFPITEKMAETMLSLPIWPGLTGDDIEYIAHTIRDFFHRR